MLRTETPPDLTKIKKSSLIPVTGPSVTENITLKMDEINVGELIEYTPKE